MNNSSTKQIYLYAGVTVLPIIALPFLDTGHSWVELLIAATLFLFGMFAGFRGIYTVRSLPAKTAFAIPTAINTIANIFIIAVEFSTIYQEYLA